VPVAKAYRSPEVEFIDFSDENVIVTSDTCDCELCFVVCTDDCLQETCAPVCPYNCLIYN